MIIKIGDNYKPYPRKGTSYRKFETTYKGSFEDAVFSSVIESEGIKKISEKLEDLESRLETEFSSEIVEEYKEVIKDLIKKLSNLAKVVEKSSLRSKDKRLKFIVFADTNLRKMLEKLISEHITKASLMNLSSELKGILMSLLA